MNAGGDHFRSFFIVNPKASGGSASRAWNQIMKAIVEGGFAGCDWKFTEGPGDAARLAREAFDRGVEMVVSVGGDGTNNEVLNGAYGCRDPIIGFVPRGTGGDFRRVLNLSREPAEAVAALCGHTTRSVDIGRIHYTKLEGGTGERLFFNIASCGMSGLSDRYVNEGRKPFGRKLAYLTAAMRASFSFDPPRVRIRLDDGAPFEEQVSMVVVANGKYFGSGMRVAPGAEIDDGLFDVVVVKWASRATVFLKGWKLFSGAHVNEPYVQQYRAKRVTIEPCDIAPGRPCADDSLLIDLDGEVPGRLPATFEIIPGAVRVKVASPNGANPNGG